MLTPQLPVTAGRRLYGALPTAFPSSSNGTMEDVPVSEAVQGQVLRSRSLQDLATPGDDIKDALGVPLLSGLGLVQLVATTSGATAEAGEVRGVLLVLRVLQVLLCGTWCVVLRMVALWVVGEGCGLWSLVGRCHLATPPGPPLHFFSMPAAACARAQVRHSCFQCVGEVESARVGQAVCHHFGVWIRHSPWRVRCHTAQVHAVARCRCMLVCFAHVCVL